VIIDALNSPTAHRLKKNTITSDTCPGWCQVAQRVVPSKQQKPSEAGMGSFKPPGQKNIIEEIIPAKTENDCNNRIDTITWWFSVLKVVRKKVCYSPIFAPLGWIRPETSQGGQKLKKKKQHANRREGGAIGRDLQKLAFYTHFWGRQQWKNLGTRRGMGSCPQGGNAQRAGAPHNLEKNSKLSSLLKEFGTRDSESN